MAKKKTASHDEFIERVQLTEEGKEYSFLDEYTRSAIPMRVEHLKCGTIYTVTPNNFFSGKRCPNCISSRGEQEVKRVLDDLDIIYQRETTFPGLKGNSNALRYDFSIHNGDSILGLIEFDGRQHFEPVEPWGGESYLKEIKKYDKKKDQFAEDNDLPLLRIKYLDIDYVEEIVHEWLKLIIRKERGQIYGMVK